MSANIPQPGGLSQWILLIYSHDYFMPFVFWATWLLCGSAFYSYQLELGWEKGFYMAVNVGYSIGWGYPAEDTVITRVFSIFYVLIGASGVAACLGYFAQSMIDSSKNWYATALMQEKYQKASKLGRWRLWLRMKFRAFKVVILWAAWISLMIIFSMYTVKWNFTSALYFAVSSLSTGGNWAIPSDSPDWYFAVVGAFAATGVPLMALAMGNIASMLITIGDPVEAEKTIAAKVTLEELNMMQKFDLDDGDGQISRAEYILLCTVRLGALSPELISKINERFIELDTSGDGVLSVEEILEDAAAAAAPSANANASANDSNRASESANASASAHASVSSNTNVRVGTNSSTVAGAKINASAKASTSSNVNASAKGSASTTASNSASVRAGVAAGASVDAEAGMGLQLQAPARSRK